MFMWAIIKNILVRSIIKRKKNIFNYIKLKHGHIILSMARRFEQAKEINKLFCNASYYNILYMQYII